MLSNESKNFNKIGCWIVLRFFHIFLFKWSEKFEKQSSLICFKIFDRNSLQKFDQMARNFIQYLAIEGK